MKYKTKLQTCLEEFGPDLGFDIRSYSGRSMYGKECLAISGDNINLFELGYFLKDKFPNIDFEENVIFDIKQDSMGMGIVVYWPRIPYSKLDKPDNEDDEDSDDS